MSAVARWQREWRAERLEPTYRTECGRTVAGAAVKNVLSQLATWADYDTGHHAYPGVPRLAIASGLSEQVVRWALQVGRQLGWIERTEHRPGTGKADKYRLAIPDPRD